MPTTFYFVNKGLDSGSFSRNEAQVTSETLRHVQEQIWKRRSSRQEAPVTSPTLRSPSTNNLDVSSTASTPATVVATSRAYQDNLQGCSPVSDTSSTQRTRTENCEGAKALRPADLAVPIPLALHGQQIGETNLAPSPRSTIMGSSNIPQYTSPCTQDVHKVKNRDISTRQKQASIGESAKNARHPGVDKTWNGRKRSFFEPAGPVMRSACSSFDPFACSASPVTEQVYTCLLYFESLWISRSMDLQDSPGYGIVRNCISDELQMACLVAAMASRLENFHGYVVPSGSSQHIASAVRHVRSRLDRNANMQSRDVYAIMKLYVAEAYRSNIDVALMHLNGARAAYDQFRDWRSFDLDMASTLCGTGEAFFLPQVWSNPVVFNTIADPGSAKECFPDEPFWGLNAPVPDDRLATMLISSFRSRELSSSQLTLRMSILHDMLEYTKLRQKTLLMTNRNAPVPEDVMRWAHLRRINIVFRLLSVDTTNDVLSHCVRICLITWLAIVSDLSGFGRNLEIVAAHLREMVQQLPGPDLSSHPMLVTWMLFLGAVTGEKNSDGRWFVQCLDEYLSKSDTFSSMDLSGWIMFLEKVNEGFFYCQELQRESVRKLASDLHTRYLSSFGIVTA